MAAAWRTGIGLEAVPGARGIESHRAGTDVDRCRFAGG